MSRVLQPVVAIVQARMTSTRLPGKVLLPVLGRPLLSYQLERMRCARSLDRIVIATTVNATDDPIVDFCRQVGVDVTRGSELDVLARYDEAASRYGAATVVRLTSDCPLLDPALIDEAVGRFHVAECDYLSNMLPPTYPYGLAVEVMAAGALHRAATQARAPQEREHVTPFIYWRPTEFRLANMTMSPDLSHHRWTVDTQQDFELVRRILEALHPQRPAFTMDDVLALLERNPGWATINAHVQQQAVRSGTQETP